jgi:hypothetical protein
MELAETVGATFVGIEITIFALYTTRLATKRDGRLSHALSNKSIFAIWVSMGTA